MPASLLGRSHVYLRCYDLMPQRLRDGSTGSGSGSRMASVHGGGRTPVLRRLSHLCVSLAAAEEESVEAAVESPLAKLRDATAEADYVVSEHLPGPLQVRATRTLDPFPPS